MSTIYKVAERANVSTSTVSRYVNKRIALPSRTAARIDAAIRDLNYKPNSLAKRLSLGRAEAIGLITPDIANPFFAELAGALEDEAARHGYAVFMTSTGGDFERELFSLSRMNNGQVDGLVVMTNRPDDGTLAAALSGDLPMVVIDEDIPHLDVPKVFVENRQGAFAATRHLIAAGHRRIAHIGGPAELFSAAERSLGFRAAMAEAGIAAADELVRLGRYSRAFGRTAMLDLLDNGAPPTAVFAGSDYIAIGVIEAARERRLQVPRDLSLVGFDDMPFAEFLAPGLTTIRQPTGDLGRAGLTTLLSLLADRQPPRLTRLPVTLVDRQSVAAPRCRRD